MKSYSWLLFSLLWSGWIVYLSFIRPTSLSGTPWFDHQDKLGHFIFYAVLGLSLIKTFSKEIIIQSPLISGMLITFIFGLLIELGQHFFTTDRNGSWMDVFANGLGVLASVILINIYPKLFRFNS
ncbi:MAG: VanZ family protein [Flavobacteriaceae bacterium]